MRHTCSAYAAPQPGGPLEPYSLERRTPRPHDVVIDIAYCGVCHSDVHKVRGEWGNTHFPIVPGHEIVGHVVAIGESVQKFKTGDTVGVGVMVDSCRECPSCKEGEQQYCAQGFVPTYGGFDRHDGLPTYGGYSNTIVAHEDFVLRIPQGMDLSRTAPLLCAGITTYSPLRQFGVGPNQRVGIVGLGGLGHVAVKIARALGAHVTVITHSANKKDAALALGAHDVLVSQEQDSMAARKSTFDLLLCTVSAHYDMADYLSLLGRDGRFVVVGMPDTPPRVPLRALVRQRLSVTGSLIGGVAETQEMLDFCGTHNILCDVEVIAINQINDAYDRMVRADVRYRFVIDTQSIS